MAGLLFVTPEGKTWLPTSAVAGSFWVLAPALECPQAATHQLSPSTRQLPTCQPLCCRKSMPQIGLLMG